MRQPISFGEFLKLPKDVQESMATFENAYITEELSSSVRKKKMVDLERKLKNFDWWYSMSDDIRSYKKGQKEQDVIRSIVDELGDDGMSLYRQYGKKAGVTFREGVGDRKKAITQPSEYEEFLQSKMKEWGIESLEQLQPEPLKRFWKEVDSEWKGNDEVEVNVSENKSMFPEMDKVTRQGLGYGEERPVGGKSKHGFVDAGNLYPEHLVPKWIPPSPQRKRGWQDK
jgi:hypothetical protein